MVMGRGKSTFRKRDLKVAREIAKPGDLVEAKPDGTITIITRISGEANAANGGTIRNEWDAVFDNGNNPAPVR
jgi:hypothetical protein